MSRRSVRVIVLDADHRVLLLRWRDPADPLHVVWEPPGGGIDPGESEAAAAVREVAEETGFMVEVVPGRRVLVRRDVWWNGRRHVLDEPFLLTTVSSAERTLLALTADEDGCLLDTRWLTWPEIERLDDGVLEPPDLLGVLRALDPGGPWPHDG